MLNEDPRLRSGADLFNQEKFFAAHEVWEDCWRESVGPLRAVLQGLVQAAAGFHHLQSGNREGAISLLAKAESRLRTENTAVVGAPWDLGSFQRALADRVRALKAGITPVTYPRL